MSCRRLWEKIAVHKIGYAVYETRREAKEPVNSARKKLSCGRPIIVRVVIRGVLIGGRSIAARSWIRRNRLGLIPAWGLRQVPVTWRRCNVRLVPGGSPLW